MIKEIITIKASDIHNSRYFDSKDCAIRRALDRAKVLERYNARFDVEHLRKDTSSDIIADITDLDRKVQAMYSYAGRLRSSEEPVEPVDFDYTINIKTAEDVYGAGDDYPIIDLTT